MSANFEGVYSVLPTPFTSAGKIDVHGLKRTINLYIRAGIDGLTASGVTSETARLNETQRMLMIETVIMHVNKSVPIVVGTSTEGLHTCMELTKRAKELGASAVMISPPRMQKLNSDAVVNHYHSIADAVDIPIVIQDYPPISGFTMEPSLLVRIAREVPRAHIIKLEDPPTPLKIARVLQQSGDLKLNIFGGLGGTYLFEELMAGATGTMTGFAIPEILVRVMRLFKSGEKEKAADYFYRYVALMRFEFQEGIGMSIRKEILRRRGVIENAAIRPPGTSLDDSTQKALDSILTWFQQNGDISL
jgi:4-hydroxy-tetrahydrodipicolinate synthase